MRLNCGFRTRDEGPRPAGPPAGAAHGQPAAAPPLRPPSPEGVRARLSAYGNKLRACLPTRRAARPAGAQVVAQAAVAPASLNAAPTLMLESAGRALAALGENEFAAWRQAMRAGSVEEGNTPMRRMMTGLKMLAVHLPREAPVLLGNDAVLQAICGDAARLLQQEIRPGLPFVRLGDPSGYRQRFTEEEIERVAAMLPEVQSLAARVRDPSAQEWGALTLRALDAVAAGQR